MGYGLKQSSAARPLAFYLTDAADNVSPLTGATGIAVTLSKNGGAFGAAAGAISEIGNGWYKCTGNATDTNTVGPLLLHATATGAVPYDTDFDVQANLEDDLATALATVQGYTDTLETVVAAVQAAANTINTNTDTLESSATSLATAVAAVNTAVVAVRAVVDIIAGYTDTVESGIAALPAAILDHADGVETGLTLRQWLRLGGSVLFGKASGAAAGPIVFRDYGDTKPRVTMTTDSAGNRSTVTKDAT